MICNFTPRALDKAKPTRHFQFLHLRFLDLDSGKIHNSGGFTLAYCVIKAPNSDRLTLSYSFAECSLADNFSKRVGRSIAGHRLDQHAEEWLHTYYLDLVLPQAPEGQPEVTLSDVLFPLDDKGAVDIRETVLNLRAEVLNSFVQNHGAFLYEGGLQQYIITRGNQSFLDYRKMAVNYDEFPMDLAHEKFTSISEDAAKVSAELNKGSVYGATSIVVVKLLKRILATALLGKVSTAPEIHEEEQAL